jgi:ankyrin repeat protein
MAASKAGSAGAVAALLAHGANANASETARGQTALMWAAAEGHDPIVRLLVENRADVRVSSRVRRVLVNRGDFNTSRTGNRIEETDRGGFTPLMFAARNGHLEVCHTLIAAGVNVNDAAPDGTTVLLMAAHSGHGTLAAALLDRGADPNAAGAGYAPIHAAVLRGDHDLVLALLKHGADPNLPISKGNPLRRFGEQQFVLPGPLVGSTPFLLAARYAEADIMKTLIESGANASATMPDGTTALMLAAGVGWVDTGVGGWADRRGRFLPAGTAPGGPDWSRTLAAVEIAAAQGIDVNAVNRDGDRAVHGAAPKGFDSVIQFLAGKGALLDAGNKRALTPLALAARGDFTSTVDLLHKLGAKE